MYKISDLRERDVINIYDGKRLGSIVDIDVDPMTGRILAIIVPGPGRFLGLFGHSNDYVIPWERIVRIGPDVILVDLPVFGGMGFGSGSMYGPSGPGFGQGGYGQGGYGQAGYGQAGFGQGGFVQATGFPGAQVPQPGHQATSTGGKHDKGKAPHGADAPGVPDQMGAFSGGGPCSAGGYYGSGGYPGYPGGPGFGPMGQEPPVPGPQDFQLSKEEDRKKKK